MRETKSNSETHKYRHFTDINHAGLEELRKQYQEDAHNAWLYFSEKKLFLTIEKKKS